MMNWLWSAWDLSLMLLGVLSFILICSLGVVLTALQLPGNWLIVGAAAIVAWWRWDQQTFGWWSLALLLAIAVLGEILEFIAGAAGAKIAGASKRAAAIAIVGGIIGAIIGTPLIPIPIVGTLLGATVGAALGSILGDFWAGRTYGAAFKGGGGAAVGKLGGSVAKLATAIALWLVAVVALLWP